MSLWACLEELMRAIEFISASCSLVKEKAVGQYEELDINDVSYGGFGVGRLKGKVVFVPYAVAGDKVTVEITQERRHFSYARLVEILIPSPWRVRAPCPYFGKCGGCLLQHVSYPYQLEIKRLQVREIFQRIGGLRDVAIEPILFSPREWHYRGKMDFHGAWEKAGYVMGLRRSRGNEIVEIDNCLIAHESINDALNRLRKKRLLGRLPVWANDDEKGPYVIRKVKDHVFQVPRDAFFQANLYLVDRLVDLVTEMGELRGEETVIDAYCGVGLFTVFLAQKAKRVVGIEINSGAVEAVKLNLPAISLPRCRILTGEVGQVLSRLTDDLRGKVEVMVVDPPRGGLSRRVMEGIKQLGVRRIVYVSCNPTTMARDGAVLSQGGYELTRLVPVDMFPQTAHIEVVGRWEKLGVHDD